MPLDALTAFVERMDEALFLDGPGFRAARGRPGPPAGLHRLLRGRSRRPAPPAAAAVHRAEAGRACRATPRPDGRLRAALMPHIDYARGGATYAWGFKEVFERSDASLFVIIGTVALQRAIASR